MSLNEALNITGFKELNLSSEEYKKIFREFVKDNHPDSDRNFNISLEERKEKEEAFKLKQEAYKTLMIFAKDRENNYEIDSIIKNGLYGLKNKYLGNITNIENMKVIKNLITRFGMFEAFIFGVTTKSEIEFHFEKVESIIRKEIDKYKFSCLKHIREDYNYNDSNINIRNEFENSIKYEYNAGVIVNKYNLVKKQLLSYYKKAPLTFEYLFNQITKYRDKYLGIYRGNNKKFKVYYDRVSNDISDFFMKYSWDMESKTINDIKEQDILVFENRLKHTIDEYYDKLYKGFYNNSLIEMFPFTKSLLDNEYKNKNIQKMENIYLVLNDVNGKLNIEIKRYIEKQYDEIINQYKDYDNYNNVKDALNEVLENSKGNINLGVIIDGKQDYKAKFRDKIDSVFTKYKYYLLKKETLLAELQNNLFIENRYEMILRLKSANTFKELKFAIKLCDEIFNKDKEDVKKKDVNNDFDELRSIFTDQNRGKFFDTFDSEKLDKRLSQFYDTFDSEQMNVGNERRSK